MAYAIAWILTSLVVLILRRKKSAKSERQQKFIKGPIRFLVIIIIARSNFDLLAPSLEAQAIIELQTLVIIAITWLVMGISNLVIGKLADRMQRAGNENATMLLRPAGTAIKLLIVLFAALHWFENMGYDVTTLLAGLGIGSLAIALAAQKSIENLIGSITLYAAQPIRIGDFCRFGNTMGIVEEIGLRSSKIRTLDRTIVSVPNATLSNIEIENFAERDKILYRHNIRLRISTTPDQLRYVLITAREMLIAHPKVDLTPARVRFMSIGESSLDLEVYAYILTNDFNEYLAISEDINLRLMEIIEEAGTALAIPARETLVQEVPAMDPEQAQKIEQQVAEWRDQKQLYMEEIPEERKSKIQDTLQYPPEGSPSSNNKE